MVWTCCNRASSAPQMKTRESAPGAGLTFCPLMKARNTAGHSAGGNRKTAFQSAKRAQQAGKLFPRLPAIKPGETGFPVEADGFKGLDAGLAGLGDIDFRQGLHRLQGFQCLGKAQPEIRCRVDVAGFKPVRPRPLALIL